MTASPHPLTLRTPRSRGLIESPPRMLDRPRGLELACERGDQPSSNGFSATFDSGAARAASSPITPDPRTTDRPADPFRAEALSIR